GRRGGGRSLLLHQRILVFLPSTGRQRHDRRGRQKQKKSALQHQTSPYAVNLLSVRPGPRSPAGAHAPAESQRIISKPARVFQARTRWYRRPTPCPRRRRSRRRTSTSASRVRL